MSLDQCWDLARRWYHGRDDAGYRGRTAGEASVIFEEVGLHGAFWRMG